MRSTWILVAVVVAGGVLAWLSLSSDDDASVESSGATSDGRDETPERPVSLRRENKAPARPAPAKSSARDKIAEALLTDIERARKAGDDKAAARLELDLRKKAWSSAAARRYAVARGHELAAQAAEDTDRPNQVRRYDQARRYLSRGLFLPEMFEKNLTDTRVRSELKTKIQAINRKVMRYAPGLPGVTARYIVDPGIRPVEIVARDSSVGEKNTLTVYEPGTGSGKQLPMGPNAVMFWNQGNLRSKSMRAGATYVIPLEELTIHVHQRYFRLALFMGDWFVKEFRVGVGRRDTPTPVGEFKVDSKEENPDWWFNGKLIKFGDPKNELGSRWIAVFGEDLPLSAGIGIHGTNKPDTVGSRCSNGCVRLKNADVNELFWWVRTGYNGGPATRIFIR